MQLFSGSLRALSLAGILSGSLSMAQSVQVCSYNVFILGNETSSYSDVQGSAAIGGNASFTGYSIGQSQPNNSAVYNLVVGGTLNLNSGQVNNGSVAAGGNITLSSATIFGNVVSGGTVSLNNGHINGSVLQNQPNPLPVNFGYAASFLQNTSTLYSAQPVNGQTVSQYGGLYLTGTNPVLNVFFVSGSVLANVWGVQLTVPPGSSVLINVDGTSDKLPNGGFNYSGVTASQVLYNFYQATSLNIGGDQGTILAPFANITFPYGVATGTIIGASLTGNGQTNLATFTGQLPQPASNGTFCNDQPSGGGRQ